MIPRRKLFLALALVFTWVLAPIRPAQAFFFCPPFGNQDNARSTETYRTPRWHRYNEGRGFAWPPAADYRPVRPWSYDPGPRYVDFPTAPFAVERELIPETPIDLSSP